MIFFRQLSREIALFHEYIRPKRFLKLQSTRLYITLIIGIRTLVIEKTCVAFNARTIVRLRRLTSVVFV